MKNKLKEIAYNAVAFVTDMSIEDRYNIFENSRVKKIDVIRTMNEYNKTFVVPKIADYNTINLYEIKIDNQNSWCVIAPLWTKEEGRSDLSLELTVIFGKDGVRVLLDDCRVL